MGTFNAPDGEREAAKVAIHAARRVLLQNALKFEPGSDEARCLMKAAKSLTRVFKDSEDTGDELNPALIKHYVAQLLGPSPAPRPGATPPGGPTPGPRPGALPMGPGAQMGAMPG